MEFISLLLLIVLGLIIYYLREQKSEISSIKYNQNNNYNKLLEIEHLLKKLNEKQLPSTEIKPETESIIYTEVPIIQPIETVIEHAVNIDASVELVEEKTDLFENEEIEVKEITEPLIELKNRSLQAEAEPNYTHSPSPKEFSLHSWFTKFKADNPDIEKFIGENLINKIGALILVLGISFFVKYAIDKDWINEPSRVAIGIVTGALILTIAHKLRIKFVAFSSVLVASAISVFYFTIGIAFHDYQLFNQGTAFSIMVVITIFAVFVSIVYNRQELAVLSTIAGFAVPFMVSTGTGSYIVLLTYISILNMGMLIISYYKRWFIVNFTALIATLLVVAGWYVTWQEPTNSMNYIALLFCTLFYFIFALAFTINNIVNKNRFHNYEMSAIFIATALYYSIGYNIISQIASSYLGLFTIVLGLINIIFAYFIYKQHKYDKNVIYVFIGLALTFATLTIPIQLEGNFITIFWAAEAVLLFWLSKKSQMKGFAISAVIVQFLMFLSTLINLVSYNGLNATNFIGLNINFITNLIVIASLITTYRLLKNHTLIIHGLYDNALFKNYSQIVYYAALIFGYCCPMLEIAYQGNRFNANPTSIFFYCYLYHMLYTSAILFYNSKYKKEYNAFIKIMIIFNMVLYVLIGYKFPLLEKINGFNTETATNIVFILHYISLALLIYQSCVLFKVLFLNEKQNRRINSIIPWAFAFFITYLISAEVNVIFLLNSISYESFTNTKYQVIKVAFPILWGVISFAFLIYGIKRNIKPVRIIALVLLGITIVKLFAYDIKDVSETGKIIAFILLGVLILIISFIYQKIKKLVVDDNEK